MTREEFLALMFTHMIQADGELAFKVAQVAADYEREQCERLVWDTPEPDDEYVSHREAIAAAIRARSTV